MTNYSWSPQVSGPGKCVCDCACVSMLVPRQTEELRLREAGRVLTAYCCTDECLCSLTASICSAHTRTHTHTHSKSVGPCLRRPFDIKCALQSEGNWSRWDKDGHECDGATGDTKVTKAVPVYSHSSAPCLPHSLTLALYTVSAFYTKS